MQEIISKKLAESLLEMAKEQGFTSLKEIEKTLAKKKAKKCIPAYLIGTYMIYRHMTISIWSMAWRTASPQERKGLKKVVDDFVQGLLPALTKDLSRDLLAEIEGIEEEKDE